MIVFPVPWCVKRGIINALKRRIGWGLSFQVVQKRRPFLILRNVHLRPLKCMVINLNCCFLLSAPINIRSLIMPTRRHDISISVIFSNLGFCCLGSVISRLRLSSLHKIRGCHTLFCDLVHYRNALLLLYRWNTFILLKIERHIGLNLFELAFVRIIRNCTLLSKMSVIKAWRSQWVILMLFVEISCWKASTTSTCFILNFIYGSRISIGNQIPFIYVFVNWGLLFRWYIIFVSTLH